MGASQSQSETQLQSEESTNSSNCSCRSCRVTRNIFNVKPGVPDYCAPGVGSSINGKCTQFPNHALGSHTSAGDDAMGLQSFCLMYCKPYSEIAHGNNICKRRTFEEVKKFT